MTSKDKFVMLVQTEAIVTDVRTGQTKAPQVVWQAMDISSDLIEKLDFEKPLYKYAHEFVISAYYDMRHPYDERRWPDWLPEHVTNNW